MQTMLPDGKRPRRLGMLDAMRFVAAMSVVAFHYTARHSPGWNGPVPEELAGVGQWAAYGRMGVPLFFVISGFVLLMSAWGKDIPSFVASRVGRLFPAYWVAVTFSIVLVLYVWPENLDFLGHEVTTSGALLNYTMVQGAFGVADVDGPYWTLWYEARFYALIAVLVLIGLTRGRVLAFCALWPIAGAISAGSQSDLLTTILMPDYAPFFAGGMLLYLVYRDGHDLGTWLLIGLQALIALNFSVSVYPGVLAAETPWPPSKVVIALVTFACFGLVALVTLTPLADWDMRWMTVAGALTYPVYLVHENLGWYVIHLLRGQVSPWIAVLAATVAALVAAVALHYLVEERFGNRLRKATLAMLRSTSRDRARPAPVTAAAGAAPDVLLPAPDASGHAAAGRSGRHGAPARWQGEPAPAPQHGPAARPAGARLEPSTMAMRTPQPAPGARAGATAPVQRGAVGRSAMSSARVD